MKYCMQVEEYNITLRLKILKIRTSNAHTLSKQNGQKSKKLLYHDLKYWNKPTVVSSLDSVCYKVMQVFMVTGLFAGQHNTKLHGTIIGVIYTIVVYSTH